MGINIEPALLETEGRVGWWSSAVYIKQGEVALSFVVHMACCLSMVDATCTELIDGSLL